MKYQTLELLLRCGKDFNHKKIRNSELSETECMLCSYIFLHEGCSQEDVSNALKTDKTTVSKALTVLEQKKLVSRVCDIADRRVKRLNLTEAGKEKVASLAELHDNWLSRILTCLSEDEQRQFESFCERLLDAAEKLANETEEY